MVAQTGETKERRNQIMERTDTSGMFNISGPHNDNRIDLDYPEAGQNIGTAIAIVVVVIGWTINKMFRKEVLW
jgi:hypothetical protein